MKRIRVNLNYRANSNSFKQLNTSGPAFPVRALDSEGTVLAEGVASNSIAADLQIPADSTQVFIRLTWPSGRAEIQRASFDVGQDDQAVEVSFFDEGPVSDERTGWAIPKLNVRTPLTRSENDLSLNLGKFDRVWLRLWRFANGVWQQERLKPEETYRSGAAWQFDLQLDSSAWLLQIGGSQVIWRFVALPSGGPARVLITPSASKDLHADLLKVVVTGFREEAESLLEFLARDSVQAAGAMAEFQWRAAHLFNEKYEDPVAAVAAAYYLLRVNRWSDIPERWFDNLANSFTWIADPAIIFCIRHLRDGFESQNSEQRARSMLVDSLNRGWPIFAEGVSLLEEAAALLRDGASPLEKKLFKQVEALGAAKAWAGAATSFYGRYPNEPSALKWVGMPSAPRRHSLKKALRNSTPETVSLPPESPPVQQSQSQPRSGRGLSSRSYKSDISSISGSSDTRDENGEFFLGSIPGEFDTGP